MFTFHNHLQLIVENSVIQDSGYKSGHRMTSFDAIKDKNGVVF